MINIYRLVLSIVFVLSVCFSVTLSAAPKSFCTIRLEKAETIRNRHKVQLKRYLLPLSEIEKTFMNEKGALVLSVDEAIEKMIATDLRLHLFRLEALFRLHKKTERYAEEFIRWRELMKEFEDKLGAAVDSRSAIKKAASVDAPNEVITYLESEAKRKYGELKKYVSKNGWIPGSKNSSYVEMDKMLSDMDWPKLKTDREEIREAYIKQVEKIIEGKFDMNDLQGGVHELRRQIRWLLIDVHALRGGIKYDESAKIAKDLRPYVYMPQLPKSFFKYDIDEGVKHTIELPGIIYLSLSNLTAKFGQIKDNGELMEILVHAFENSKLGMSPKKAHESAQKILESKSLYVDFKEDAHKTYQMMQDTYLMEHLLDYMKK